MADDATKLEPLAPPIQDLEMFARWVQGNIEILRTITIDGAGVSGSVTLSGGTVLTINHGLIIGIS